MRMKDLRNGTHDIFQHGAGGLRSPVLVTNDENDAETLAACLALQQSGLELRPLTLHDDSTEDQGQMAEAEVEFHRPAVDDFIPKIVRLDELHATITFDDGRRQDISPTLLLEGGDETEMLVMHTADLRMSWEQLSDILYDAYRDGINDDSYGEDQFGLKTDLHRYHLRMQRIAQAIMEGPESGILMAMGQHAQDLDLDPMGWPERELRTTVTNNQTGGTVTLIVRPGAEPERAAS